MQLVRNGPDLPERLLQAHEDGRVVFFCGAGISFPAGLPSFAGLVTELYASLSITPNPIQQAAIEAGQLDTAIGLLEADIVGGRGTVRRAIAGILKPDLTPPNALATHEALLTLAKDREGRTRLITTNFDRLFEEVIAAQSLSVERFRAPLLPVPKRRWNGLVYLHGLLTAAPTLSELDRLVVSSGDFGLAYLTERWAARFISDLFRDYTVCFVGYSINDPVLRYMMDALAADRLLGESPPEMFAFGSFSKRKEEARANEWRAKNVTPILYRERSRHAYLHRTLREWAELYRDGVRGKERIVVECAVARPLLSTKEDDFVGRLLWALSDPQGLPAKRFADLDPVPSLDWLEPLSSDRYGHSDLARFGVPPKAPPDDKLSFSITYRLTPYALAPRMALAGRSVPISHWDPVMGHVARWLIRHLDNPQLLLWIVNRGGCLHEDMASSIDRRLNELGKLEQDGKSSELADIRQRAPDAVPRRMMRTLWRLVVGGRLKTRSDYIDLYSWTERFKRDGLTASTRMELREILTPRISLRAPSHWPEEVGESAEPQRIRDIVEWEIELSADHVHSGLNDLRGDSNWTAALPALLADFTALLRDTLDLMRELGGAEDLSDMSYIAQPSISEHPQNRDFEDWTALIELLRDAWIATARQSPNRARLAAGVWWQVPYPLFRRLAFFAASQGDIVPRRVALDWLLADAHWWLWSAETEREAHRLLIALAPNLDEPSRAELERAILAGPPRAMFKADIDPERWTSIVDRDIWLRLVKVAQTGATLSATGKDRLETLSAVHPEWQLTADDRDEFPVWTESGWTGDRDPWRPFVATPRSRRGLLNYLIQHPVLEAPRQDDWAKRCRESFQATAYALFQVSRAGVWPDDRWRDALQAWSDDKLVQRSWRYMGPVIVEAPNEVLQAIAHSVSWWLRAIADKFAEHEAVFIRLAKRVLQLQYEDDETDDVVGRAINHPIGHVVDALLHWWYRRSPVDKQGLPENLKDIFSEVSDTRVQKFRHGRVLLAAHVIALFRVDQNWTTDKLLPLFDWLKSENEARAAWEGFLWSPRLYRPLMEAFKDPFLETAKHYSALGEHARQYAALLTFAALDPGDTFTVRELASATRALPKEGLEEAAQTLANALEGSGDQRVDYWANRVIPYLRTIWPKTLGHNSPAIAEQLGLLCLAAGKAFPDAFEMLRPWLQPVPLSHYLVHRLHEAGHAEHFPEAALAFLDLVIPQHPQWAPGSELSSCLTALSNAQPGLLGEHRYERLLAIARGGR
jgi:hypothetical protein